MAKRTGKSNKNPPTKTYKTKKPAKKERASTKKESKLDSIKNKMNAIVKDSGAKFSEVRKLPDGRYEVIAEVGNQSPLSGPIVQDINYEEGSLLHRLALIDQKEALEKRLEIAKLRSTLKNHEAGTLDVQYRDKLGPSYLDIREKTADLETAIKLYSRSEKEYYTTGIYGTALDLLSNFAASGFYNETTNKEVKEYYDAWVRDSDFVYTVKKIFHSLFKYSVCYIMSYNGVYEPHIDGISSIPGKEPKGKGKTAKASDFNLLNKFMKQFGGGELDYETFSKVYDQTFPNIRTNKEKGANGGIPVSYTILDPKHIQLRSSGFFNKYTVSITSKGLQPIRDLVKAKQEGKASKTEAEVIKMIPSKMRKAAEENQAYTFEDGEVSIVFLRKDDYETYAKPRGSRAFDSFDYKDELKKADFATLDGVYNYILKITVGDKDNPAADPETLQSLAKAFNTPQKSFAVVWNHTLNIEKITNKEVGAILGKAKYEPVEQDITAALGMARALIDGGNISGEAAVLTTKALKSEIENARQQVEHWIYSEYRKLAMSASFNLFPVVRWKQSIVNTDTDAVTISSYMQMADRKISSVETISRELGFDFDTEVTRMEEELPLVQQGILLAGSPYQQKDSGPTQNGLDGRPKGEVTGPKEEVNPKKVVKRLTKAPTPGESASNLDILINELKELDDKTKELIVKSIGSSNSKELESIVNIGDSAGQELISSVEQLENTTEEESELDEE